VPESILSSPSPTIYFIRNDHKRLLDYAYSRLTRKELTNILIKGPQGCGKSTMPEQFASVHGLPFAVIEMGLFSEASQIFGSLVIEDGQTIYKPGLFTTAIQTPNCVIHIQEINRPESDKTLNAMFSVLDERQRSLWIDDAQSRIKVAPGVTFFATLNEGYEFVGTTPLDQALEDRFGLKIQLDYLPQEQEQNLLVAREGITVEIASNIVTLANYLRTNAQATLHISTRNVMEMARLIKYGIPFQDAVKATVTLDEDQLETVLQSIQFGGMEHLVHSGPRDSDRYSMMV
jgi:nitric oxide reductase NorQ protein